MAKEIKEDEQKKVEETKATPSTPATGANQEPQKEQKPINFKQKYIALGVLGAILIVVLVLCCNFVF